MKKETRQRINAALDAYERRLHPKLPIPDKACETNSNALTKTIIKFLKAEGWQAERVNTMGVPIIGDVRVGNVVKKGVKGWRHTTATRGSADIHATIAGVSVKIEVKFLKDTQSKHQKAYQSEVEAAGGIYYIARDLDSFLEWYDGLNKSKSI